MSLWIPPDGRQGVQKYALYLPHGQSEITNIHGLITRHLAHQSVAQDHVQIIKPTNESPVGWVDDRAMYSMETASYERHDVMLRKMADLNRFCAERFRMFLSKKPIEFNVGELSVDNLEKLAVKYMENFGSDSSVIVLEQLNKYLKLAAIIDTQEAFRIYRTDDRTKGELVELNPKKWVVGKYEDDRAMFMKFHENVRYSNGRF